MSDKCTVFKQKLQINAGARLLDLSRPLVMGILNATPDSFFADSRNSTVEEALKHCARLLNEGASIIDIGAYSTRPGAKEISAEEELDRLLPIVGAIRANFPQTILSIDTFRAQVAREAIHAGAHIINDVSGGELDPEMFATVGSLGVPYILMHMRGTPQTMASLNQYRQMTPEIMQYFGIKVSQLRALGVQDIILDPGFGFAKDTAQNFELMGQLNDIVNLGLPVLVGISRKKMICETLNIPASEALNGTTVINTLALLKGAHILRVHDVKAAAEAVALVEAYGNAHKGKD